MSVVGRVLGVAFAFMLGACTSSVRHAVDYRGQEFAPRAAPAELESVAVLPVGFEPFGSLTARCRLAPFEGGVEGAWLSDLDCSERRLRAALRRKAAAVGAELLVGERCAATSVGRSSQGPGLRCVAKAARADGQGRAQRSLDATRPRTDSAVAGIATADQAAGFDDPTGAQAWRIEIDYDPVSGAQPRAPRPAHAVGELPSLPVSHVSLGVLTSRCAAECSVDAVRAALRVAAGRLGASDVAEIRCLEHPPGITCMATAAQPEVEL